MPQLDPKLFPDQPEGGEIETIIAKPAPVTASAPVTSSPTPQILPINGKLDPSLFPDQPSKGQAGKLFPDVKVKQKEGLIPFGTEALKRGVFRILPQQIGQAVDFFTDLGLALDPFQVFYSKEQREKLKQVDERLKEAGWGGKAFENIAGLVPVKEAPEEYRKPIKSISELTDPKRAIQVIGEQGPAMLGNIAAIIANPAYGGALMFGLEGGETYTGLNELEKQTGQKIDQFEKLTISTMVGSINAALEKLGIDVILGRVPGLKNRLAQLVLSPITETSTEGLQEINQIIAEKIGARTPQITMDDFLRLQQAAYGGAVLGIVGGGSSQAIQAGIKAIDQHLEEKIKPEKTGEIEDATTIRSDQGQIRETGYELRRGTEEGSENIQFPPSGQPGGATQRAEEKTIQAPEPTPVRPSAETVPETPGGRILTPSEFIGDVVSTPGQIGRRKVEKFVEENSEQVPGMIEELRKIAPQDVNAAQVLDIMTQATGEKPKTPKAAPLRGQPKKEGAATVRSWLRDSGLRINTADLKRYGFGEGSQENRNLILQVGAKEGVGADEAAMQAIEQGIIPPPPPEYNPADWFMEKVRNNELTVSEDERQQLISQQRKAQEEAPPKEITDKESLAKNLVFINPVQAEAVSEIADARAEAWAAQTGKDKSEWYKSRIAGVETGLSPAYKKMLEEEGRGLTQEVMFQAAEQTKTPEFKRWFVDSKVVDEKNGKPLIVYHGTPTGRFEVFDESKRGTRTLGKFDESRAFHFTDNKQTAISYSGSYANKPIRYKINGQEKTIYPKQVNPDAMEYSVFLSMKNPLSLEKSKQITAEVIKKAKQDGYDGIITNEGNGTEYVVFEPTQIKSATGNRGTFDPENPNILFQAAEKAPVFYSKLSRTISEKMGGAANPQQLMTMLKNAGVKDEEIEWSGLEQFLADKTKVSKDEVQRWVEENAVQVKEVLKGAKRDLRIEQNEEGLFNLVDEGGNILTTQDSREAAQYFLDNLQKDFQAETGPTKFHQYVLPGGENYRELLLTLPDSRAEIDWEVNERFTRLLDRVTARLVKEGKIEEGIIINPYERRGDLSPNEAKELDTIDELAERPQKFGFKSFHFDEPNILAHVRFNERKDAEGKRVLFVEEVQSDWHQAGRKKGYKEEKSLSPQAKELRDLNKLTYQRDLTEKEEKRRKELFEQGYTKELERKLLKGVPDAPFKTAWPELAFKRMMRWAAENGFDKIAWTTGEQQAERYDLSKQVDYIQKNYHNPEDFYLDISLPTGMINLKVGNDGKILSQSGTSGISEFSGKGLDEVIGKELADKILSGDKQMKLEGTDLKVGGEGMKAFYDKMLVNTANKLGKRFGARVEEDKIFTSTEDQNRIMATAPLDEAIKMGKKFTETVHSLPITNEMRFTLLNEGMPLFQRNKGAVEFTQDGRAIIHAFETADVSTAVHELAHVFRKDLNETDSKTVLDWAGEETWTVAAEEKFARGFEKYLRDGEAPTPALKQVFENFKRWLTQIYQTVSGSAIDVNITPEIKDVFDRLLGKGTEAPQDRGKAEAAKVSHQAEKSQQAAEPALPLPPTEQKAEPSPTPEVKKPKKHVPGERSFPKTLEESELEGGTDRVYEVFADKKAIKLAKGRIEENEETALRYARDDTQRLSKEQVTTGILLLEKMRDDYAAAETQAEKENLAEKQIELANSLSRRLTQAGQSIQAASIVARLSPEGLLLYTQKKINQINRTRPETRQIAITPQDVESINTISKNIAEAVEVDENVKDVVNIVNKIGRGQKLTAEELKKMADLNNQLQKDYGDKPAKKKTVKEAAIDRLSKAEEAARARLKARGYNLTVGIDPGTLADFAIIGAAKVGKTGIKFLEWSGEMVSEFGEDIRPHLKKLFGKSVDLWKSEQKRARESRKLQSELNGILRKMEASTDVTETELTTVRDLLERIDTYSGEAREEALYELQDFMRSFEPVTLGRRVATAQTVAQLLNPKTSLRNILGNELFYRLERLNRYLTTPIDFAVSKITGKDRTVTFRKANQGDYWAGFIKGAKAGWQGHNIQNLETQFNLQGQTFRSKYNPLTWMEKALGMTMRGFDFAAYQRAYNQFLGEQAELDIINRKREFPNQEARKTYIDNYMKNAELHIQEMAHEYGKYITFQDENRISNAFVGLKRIMNLGKDFGIGDFVLKYPKTPANLLARALEYSPAGFAKSISILNKPFTDPNFRRREAMQALTRAITGTFGLTGLGAVFYSLGALSGGEDKDRDVREFKAQQTGERNYQVNVSAITRFLLGGFRPDLLKKRQGDYLVSYDWAQPVAISIAAGANMAKDLSENALDLKTFGDIAYSSVDAAMNTLIEQPLVRGVQETFGSTYEGSIIKRLSRILVGVPASFTPTFFSQVAQYIDNNRRITYDPNPLQQAMNKVIYKLPFVRNNLKEVYETLGGEVAENYQNGSNTLFNVFFNPAFISKYNLDPEIQKVLLPYDMENRKKQFPKVVPYTIRAAKSTLKKYGIETNKAFKTIQLEPTDIEEFQKRMAEDITKRFKNIPYHQLRQKSYEDQEKRLADEVNESYNYTKHYFFKNRAKKYIEGK